MLKKSLLISMTTLLLVACSTFSKGPTRWDGTWAGTTNLSIGIAQCPREGALRVKIDNGDIVGKIYDGQREHAFLARIKSDGTLVPGQSYIDVYKRKENAILTGKFTRYHAQGRFVSKACTGKWSINKIR